MKNKNRRYIIKTLFILICMLIVPTMSIYGYSYVGNEGIENFPESYKSYLNKLKSDNPNWKFYPLKTNLNWKDVINNEGGKTLKNAVPSKLADFWKYYPITEKEPNWDAASTAAIVYAIDPRNFLDEESIFQFEYTSYTSDEISNSESIEGVEAILKNTSMYNNKFSYTDENGNHEMLYSQAIMDAAKQSNLSAYHIASRIVQETGGNILTNRGINGKDRTYPNIYNFFNINSYPHNGVDAITCGLEYAKEEEWTNPKIAIVEGAKFIYNRFVVYGQYNKYLEKFDVNNCEGSISIYTFQYMTNIFAPYNESLIIFNAYKNSNIDYAKKELKFYIPVFDNMPDSQLSYDNVSSYKDPSDSGSNTTIPTSSIMYGDIDGDKVIDAKDLLLVKKHVINLIVLSGDEFNAADVNKDGKIDAIDVLKIQRHIVGLENIPQ